MSSSCLDDSCLSVQMVSVWSVDVFQRCLACSAEYAKKLHLKTQLNPNIMPQLHIKYPQILMLAINLRPVDYHKKRPISSVSRITLPLARLASENPSQKLLRTASTLHRFPYWCLMGNGSELWKCCWCSIFTSCPMQADILPVVGKD